MAKKQYKINVSKEEYDYYGVENELYNSGSNDYWDDASISELNIKIASSIIYDLNSLIYYRQQQLKELDLLTERKMCQLQTLIDHGESDYRLISFICKNDIKYTFLLSPKGYWRTGDDFKKLSLLKENDIKFFTDAYNFIDKRIAEVTANDKGELKNKVIEFCNEKKKEFLNV
ncbi:hypothetical protein [Schinkia azotoformans]|uniref:hypothetical protein n=1 Tax=Schinkia azotoformans TaxID=1454 RepID=UPI002DC00CAE|nr:hypothetical protein [Schinkia azotoformans]MEC1744099.1 hypothetical protein [Schinkia azotoformans]